MKRIFTLLTLALTISVSMTAQERYLDEVFTDVSVTEDVVYGTNATLLTFAEFGEAVPEDLMMDIYEPTGDTETNRPVVLVFHTGNFLPNLVNGQISGTRKDNGPSEVCRQLARRGYVAASVTYRKGWNPLADTQPIRALGLIQAAYRGIQDGRNAIRFMRKTVAEDGNTYGIDPDKIVGWGNGTGGYLVLGLATLDNYGKIPVTTNGEGKFLLDLNMDGTPETPMVVPDYHGDIEGKILTIAPNGAFGPPMGDTTNYPNHVDYSSDLNLAINAGGDLGDISWLDENSTPILTVQSAYDIFAPYEDAVLVVPTTGDDIVRVQGGLTIHTKQNELGTNQQWIDLALEDEVTMKARANSATAGHDYIEGLFPITNAPNSSGLDEGVVLDWWDPNDLSPPFEGFPNGAPWNMIPYPGSGGALTFHTQGLILNEGMSEEKAVGNITEIVNFFAPRAYATLNLGTVSTKDPVLDASVMTVSPNPATTNVKITTTGLKIESITIFGTDGRVYDQIQNINAESTVVSRGNLPTGIYFVKAYTNEGVATQRVVFE